MKTAPSSALARALRGFFADHLPKVRGASPHTVRSYRDASSVGIIGDAPGWPRFNDLRVGRPRGHPDSQH